MFTKYQHKEAGVIVEAIQFTGKNLDEIKRVFSHNILNIRKNVTAEPAITNAVHGNELAVNINFSFTLFINDFIFRDILDTNNVSLIMISNGIVFNKQYKLLEENNDKY